MTHSNYVFIFQFIQQEACISWIPTRNDMNQLYSKFSFI